MKELAHAKVNFGLRVLGRRPDGFHDIDTRLVKLELADQLVVRCRSEAPPGGGIQMTVSGDPTVPLGSANLCWQAAEAWCAAAGIEPSCAIDLEKRTPTAAGLGGGSSDAAAVLKSLNAAHRERLDSGTLHCLAARLGSDVPFFLLGAPAARATGRGTRLEPLAGADSRPVLLVVPPLQVRAADAYRWWSEDAGAADGSVGRPRGDLANDLEAPVVRRHPVVLEALACLDRAGARRRAMSGSGPCVFGVFDTLDQRDAANARLATDPVLGNDWRVIATRTLSDPPREVDGTPSRGGS